MRRGRLAGMAMSGYSMTICSLRQFAVTPILRNSLLKFSARRVYAMHEWATAHQIVYDRVRARVEIHEKTRDELERVRLRNGRMQTPATANASSSDRD